MHNAKEFAVVKPYDAILINAVSGEKSIIESGAALYLARIAKNISAFKVNMNEMRIEMPHYRIKRNRSKYSVFEVVS